MHKYDNGQIYGLAAIYRPHYINQEDAELEISNCCRMFWPLIFSSAIGAHAAVSFSLGIQKRESGSGEVAYYDQDKVYYINVQVGSQKQSMKLPLTFYGVHVDLKETTKECVDSASNDYLPDLHSWSLSFDKFFTNDTFDKDDLDTFEVLLKNSSQKYLYLAQDQITLGDLTAQNVLLQMHRLCTTEVSMNLGLAFHLENRTLPEYEKRNFVQLLKEQNQTRASVASFVFPKDNTTEGSVLIGGVDKSWYNGTLGKVKMINPFPFAGYSSTDNIVVILDGFSVGDTQLDVQPCLVTFVPGYTFLPSLWIEALTKRFGGVYEDEYLNPVFLKSAIDGIEDITFSFGGNKLTIPMEELVVLYNDTHYVFVFEEHRDEPLEFRLGTKLMLLAYWVFDYDNREVGIAQLRDKRLDQEMFVEAVSGIPEATQGLRYSLTYLNEYLYATETTVRDMKSYTYTETFYGTTSDLPKHFSLVLAGRESNGGSELGSVISASGYFIFAVIFLFF